MGGKTKTTSKIAAMVLLIVNLGVMVFCTMLFSCSLWMIASPHTMSAAIENFGSSTLKALLPRETLSVQLGVGTAALATFFFFIAFMGFYGAINRSKFLLFMYATLVLLLLLLECALLYYFSSNLIEKGLQEQDGQWTHALRLAFKCCEFNITIQDVTTMKLPWSCCGTAGYPANCTAVQVYNKNCNKTITSWLQRYQTAIYASLSVLHIILSSCALVRRSRSSSLSHS